MGRAGGGTRREEEGRTSAVTIRSGWLHLDRDQTGEFREVAGLGLAAGGRVGRAQEAGLTAAVDVGLPGEDQVTARRALGEAQLSMAHLRAEADKASGGSDAARELTVGRGGGKGRRGTSAEQEQEQERAGAGWRRRSAFVRLGAGAPRSVRPGVDSRGGGDDAAAVALTEEGSTVGDFASSGWGAWGTPPGGVWG
ncbi:hypothetical protein HETIRDRAFT_424985 [Heterobasidion irregulare TC 32-1]|uniref:Uncharacterized protein n=1 Tax=Heterobasidion irregulare (strain TC 32-1) TaxID=747525 RepID=W4KJP9_HETIT|nr:uncharacterized protein HETIRDRAFT_424985 [Heterobasidion irregulare TC 32-1]ETW85924.1 hypothetical protein HETIRDRAFT_424985 [Heterobasidion irregulare TC 32-1]